MNCAIYIRKSREEKDKEAQRLAYQREKLPAYAASRGWEVAIYDDGHASAARGKTDGLQERARLEGDIRAGRIDVILCIELSRLSRDDSLQDYVHWLDLCASHHVKLATISQTMDPADPDQWTMLIMSGGFSSREMKVITSRMREGRDQAFGAGKWLGGSPPPPYTYDKGQSKVVIDQQRLEEMRRLWELAESMSAAAVAVELGMPEIFVRRAISDDRLNIYQAIRLHPETGAVIQCEWDPVMTAGQADRIRAARRTRRTNGKRRDFAALLSGLGIFHCGYCGRTVKTWRNSKLRLDGTQINYYGCVGKGKRDGCSKGRMTQQKVVESRILVNLFGTIKSIDKLQEYWEKRQGGSNTASELAQMENEEARLRARKKNLLDALEAGAIQMADVKTRMAEINAAEAETRARRQDVLSKISAPPDWEALSLTRDEFEVLPDTDKRDFLAAWIADVRLFESYALIDYRFPRAADGSCTARVHLPATYTGRNLPKSENSTKTQDVVNS